MNFTTLCLNRIKLYYIPPQISKLRHLEFLDLSWNLLQTIPPELGMLTRLKELYLSNNRLTTIPPQLGTLYQLRTLGIGGNPITPSLEAFIWEYGAASLIDYLRESCPPPPQPPPRQWQNVDSQQEDVVAADLNPEVIRVLSYNVLCERAATPDHYWYTPWRALAWDYRKDLILTEIIGRGADFLCLQEVESAQYHKFFLEKLSEHEYGGSYCEKLQAGEMDKAGNWSVDGPAIFYNKEK